MSRPTYRWSKKTDELVWYVAQRCRPGFQSELGNWLEDNSRFRTFLVAHQDKVRKKLTTSDDEASRLDVRSELLVAYLILADRRFEVSFEAYGARSRGPDLTVSYRANQRCNLEVTRLRATGEAPASPEGANPGTARLANVLASKLRQLPGEIPNALVISSRGLELGEDALAAAARLLKSHADARDDAFFARRGFKSARDFYAQYLRLGGAFLLDETDARVSATFVANREARHPLFKEAVAALSACLNPSA
jgi:hypothetical protein